jgi:hypothetical protein
MSNDQHYMYLVPQRDTQGVVTWMWGYDGNVGTGSVPIIEAPKDSGHNDIGFVIADPLNTIKFAGYQTPGDTTNALWISPKGSPTAKQEGQYYDKKKDFDSITLQPSGTKLVLSDVNGKKLDFVYQLNFVDSSHGNHAVTAIDPEIKNGDGANNKNYLQLAELVIAGAVMGAIVSVLFVRLALRWRAA